MIYATTAGEYVRTAEGALVADDPTRPCYQHIDDQDWRLESTAAVGTREAGLLIWTWSAER